MATLNVRPAREGDIPEILAFIRELAEYERAPGEVEATEGLLHEAMFGGTPACEALIGEVDGHAQGFALFFHNFSTWKGRRGMYLEDLFVRPAARGVGLGEALLREVARIAVNRGCPRFEWSVLDWNEPAIGFYRKLGAVRMEEWTVHRLSGEALVRVASGRR